MPRIDNQKTEYVRNDQPHFQRIGATFSVTLIAHDAIPKPVLDRLINRRKRVLLEIERDQKGAKRERKAEIWRKFHAHIDKLLDAKSAQEHPFSDWSIAQAVEDRIWQYHGEYYALIAYSIMSNHIHLQLDFSVQCPHGWNGTDSIPEYHNLAQVIGWIKGGSTYDANKATGRQGTLWGRGYYDRYIRNQRHFTNEFWYILHNPEKAGLVSNWRDHPFTYGIADLLG